MLQLADVPVAGGLFDTSDFGARVAIDGSGFYHIACSFIDLADNKIVDQYGLLFTRE